MLDHIWFVTLLVVYTYWESMDVWHITVTLLGRSSSIQVRVAWKKHIPYYLPSCKLTWHWKIPVIPGKRSQHGGLPNVSLQGCTLFVRMFKWILRRCNGTPKYWKYMYCLMPRSSILAMLGKNWAAVTGHVRLHVTHTPCLSCVWAMASWN